MSPTLWNRRDWIKSAGALAAASAAPLALAQKPLNRPNPAWRG